jgi:hypothetical protein
MLGLDQVEKRRRHVLTIQQKVDVLRKIDHGVSVSQLCWVYGVGQSTIHDIKVQKNQIFQFVAESDSMAGISKRKTLCGPNIIDLDKVVYEWFHQCRSEGIPISGPMLMEKAKSYHEELKTEGDCDYSTGWLQKFKNRHGIHYLKISGEKLSANHELVEEQLSSIDSTTKHDYRYLMRSSINLLYSVDLYDI